MACTITSPTISACNDLSGGVKKIELAAWSSTFDAATATWVEMLLVPNSADWDESSTTDPKTKSTTFTQTLNFTSQGIGSFTDFNALCQAIVVARVTTYDDEVRLLGTIKGLSNNGSKQFVAREFEGGQGYEISFSGVQNTTAVTPA